MCQKCTIFVVSDHIWSLYWRLIYCTTGFESYLIFLNAMKTLIELRKIGPLSLILLGHYKLYWLSSSCHSSTYKSLEHPGNTIGKIYVPQHVAYVCKFRLQCKPEQAAFMHWRAVNTAVIVVLVFCQNAISQFSWLLQSYMRAFLAHSSLIKYGRSIMFFLLWRVYIW